MDAGAWRLQGTQLGREGACTVGVGEDGENPQSWKYVTLLWPLPFKLLMMCIAHRRSSCPLSTEVGGAEGGPKAEAVAAAPHQRNENIHALQVDVLQRHNS